MKQLILTTVFVALYSLVSFSQIPRTLSYQGVLTDSAGTPRPDGSYMFTFSLYNLISGGTRLWSETKSLTLKRGLFSTALGEVTPFPDSLKFDRAYWLNVSVSGIGELSPRTPLTSVGYSMNALRADTARVSMRGSEWIKADSNIYFLSGNIGIGTTSPARRLDVFGGIQSNTGFITTCHDYNTVLSADENGSYLEAQGPHNLRFFTNGLERLRINVDGRFQSSTGFITTCHDYNTVLSADENGSYLEAQGFHNLRFFSNGSERLRIDPSGNVGIGTTTPTEKLEIAGRTKTQVLEITGSDFAEPFEISRIDTLPFGSLVVIDPDNPGKLRQATEPYDKRVAGVISGAGGIYPGIMVSKDSKAKNTQYVAMSGKVYALATASNGAIEPGDLLTTSSVAGHAMKATDETKSHGTIIGKAMSSLKGGEGLVLVLVNLQ